LEEYLQNINLDKAIAIIGFILTIASLIYAYRQNKKNKIERRIKLSRGQSYSIIKNSPSLETDELKLLWNNKQVGNIYILEIYLKNTGTISLQTKDFLNQIIISFNEKTKILQPKVFSSSEYSKMTWLHTKNELRLDVELLESQKIIKSEIIYTNDKVSPVNIDIAILDGNVERFELKSMGDDLYDLNMNKKSHSFAVFYGNLFVFIFGGLFLIAGIFKLLEFLDFSISNTTKVLIALPIGIIALYKFISALKKDSEIEFVKNWIEFDSNK
jgi:hypothetical protein